MTHAPRTGVAAVEKAGEILATFSPLVTQLTVREIATRTGLPRSTTHALCTSLVRSGLLERRPGGGYRLGPALVGLGGQVIERTGMVAAAEGILARLPDRAGLEAHLGQLVDGWIVYLDRAVRPPLPAMDNRVGLRAPAHRSGCGKAALMLLPAAEIRVLVSAACSNGRERPVDLDSLVGELALAREQGYVVNRGFQRGRLSVAAPVIDEVGRPLGGLSIAGPSEAFVVAPIRQLADRVVDAAARVSQRLAGAGDRPARRLPDALTSPQ